MQNAPYQQFLARARPQPPWRSGAGRVLTVALTLAGALAVAVPAAALAAPRPSSPASRLVPVGVAPALPSGARVTGVLPGTAEVTGLPTRLRPGRTPARGIPTATTGLPETSNAPVSPARYGSVSYSW